MGLKTKLILIAVMLSALGIVLPISETTELEYINATSINSSGMGDNSGDNISLISEINGGYWYGNESSTSWSIDINFTNITDFDFIEVKSTYFSIVGAPTAHEVDIEVWCITDNQYVDLYSSGTHHEWQYFTRHIPDSMHFIKDDSNVTIRLNHTDNGNTNHRIWIDTVRLIKQPKYILSGNVVSGSSDNDVGASSSYVLMENVTSEREPYMKNGGGSNSIYYHNNGTTPLYVYTTMHDNTGRILWAYTGTATPPQNRILEDITSGSSQGELFFVVHPNEYYMAGASVNSNTIVIDSWVEWS